MIILTGIEENKMVISNDTLLTCVRIIKFFSSYNLEEYHLVFRIIYKEH